MLQLVAFSSLSTFQVYLPAGEFRLVVHIRDTADCITVYNLSSMIVQSDLTEMLNLMNNIADSSTNPLALLLSSGNQNIVGQAISSVSQQLNTMNDETIDEVTSSKCCMILSPQSSL